MSKKVGKTEECRTPWRPNAATSTARAWVAALPMGTRRHRAPRLRPSWCCLLPLVLPLPRQPAVVLRKSNGFPRRGGWTVERRARTGCVIHADQQLCRLKGGAPPSLPTPPCFADNTQRAGLPTKFRGLYPTPRPHMQGQQRRPAEEGLFALESHACGQPSSNPCDGLWKGTGTRSTGLPPRPARIR